jgi:predicted kinase
MPTFVLLRGNSGSGKTTIAHAIRDRRGTRDLAIIGQDVVRRDILKELDKGKGAHASMMCLMARHALAHGYHVIMEGILGTRYSGDVLREFVAETGGHVFYFDIPFEETVRRHHTKPNAHEWTVDHMRGWFKEHDLLGCPGEIMIPASNSFDDSVVQIGAVSGLLPQPVADQSEGED